MINIVTGEFTILILQKYDFKVYMISFGFYFYNFKVYIHLPCIDAQQKKNSTIYFVVVIVTGEFTILILQKYGLKVCVILFRFNFSDFKVYIHSLLASSCRGCFVVVGSGGPSCGCVRGFCASSEAASPL